jgi:hypothetical protein
MKRNFRLMGYLLVLAIMLGSLAAGPQAWATPNQTTENQTVPTRTPKPADPPTAVPPTAVPPTAVPPTAEPRPPAPQPTDVPPTSAPAPTATQRPATASPTPAPIATIRPATLSLALAANPITVWSGVTVVYTLTAVNVSAAALRDVALRVELPAELQPGTITRPKEAAWQGNALRVTLAELAAGASAEVVFTAKVAPGVPAGKIIVNRASGSAAGVTAVTAAAAIAMPPAELPSFSAAAGG